ncbi:enhanced serine sensitivity protein SseB C-terminal domain-containing protein [Lacticaseibacillus kribbianus]|uniref:enhanced serine sensitivity protein SseB C-terminal domain-containing protein n=1 Tax=Lacticaseibacillus kribbianus TaxID=2926292 RepID=UPI001CD534B1|nr:enhanced serine sensitivity protein SseB C-terminal domain-containing protein [Lacticaseibacillus kribbianus]
MTENQNDENTRSVHAITNDDLLAKWRSFSLDNTEDNMSEFLEELIERATLLMVVMSDDPLEIAPNGDTTVPNDAELQFPLLTTTKDEKIQPLFTDWLSVNQMYDNWNANGLEENVAKSAVIPVGFLDIASLITDNSDVAGLVINPFDDNINFDREALADLGAQANARKEHPDQAQVAVSEPSTVPAGLWLAVETELADHQEIKRAWLRQLDFADQSHLLLIIDAPDQSEDATQALIDALNAVAVGVLGEDAAMGMTAAPLDDDSTQLVEGGKPAYQA